MALRRCALAWLVACSGSEGRAIEALPTFPPEEAPPAADAQAQQSPPSAPSPPPATVEPVEAGIPDGGAIVCPPLSTTPDDGGRFAVALRSDVSKTLDADFSDYRGCPTVVLDQVTAARVKGTPAARVTLMVEWDPSALWVAAEVFDPKLEGADSTRPYLNDSLELYVSSAGLRTGDFGPHDHQLVVDHAGLAVRYPGAVPPAPVMLAVTVPTESGYRIEIRVDAMFAFGARLARDDVRFLDVMLNDGTDQSQFLIWAMQPHATCTCVACKCNRSPALDTLLFAPLSLR